MQQHEFLFRFFSCLEEMYHKPRASRNLCAPNTRAHRDKRSYRNGPAGLFSMMPVCNNMRRLVASWLSIAALLGTAFSGVAGAQTTPSAVDLTNAFFTLEEWIDAFALPAPESIEAETPMAGATAVCVVLRHSGRVLGTGVDTTGDSHMLRRAAARAMSGVLASLGQEADETQRDAVLELIKGSIVIELEVAGELSVLTGATYGLATERLQPGLDGLMMRRGSRRAISFPAQRRVANQADQTAQVMTSLAVELGLPAEDLPQLRRLIGDLALYRCPVLTLFQQTPDGPPTLGFRGQTLVASTDVTVASIAQSANALAEHLLQSIWPEAVAGPDGTVPKRLPLGVLGSYYPTADRHTPLTAPPLEQAIAALALAHYASAPDLTQERRAQLLEAAALILRDLASVVQNEADPLTQPVTCAMIVLAAHEHSALIEAPAIAQLAERASAQVMKLFDADDAFATLPVASGAPVELSAHSRALLTAATCRLLRSRAGEVSATQATLALDRLWQGVLPDEWTNMLPWAAWAENDHAQAADGTLRHTEELNVILRALAARQITSASHPHLPDLHGAYELTDLPHTSASAQTARVAVFTAHAIRQPELIDQDDRSLALGRQLACIRFLMQLQVRADSTWRYPSPSGAIGGVRQSTWNNTQPIAAQALSLICLTETLLSVTSVRHGG